VRADDEGCPQGHSFGFFPYAELVDQRAGGVGKLVVAKLVEFGVGTPPSELDILIVDRAAQQNSLALFELRDKLFKCDDFSGADVGKVFGVKVDDLPFAWKGTFGDVLKGRNAVFVGEIEAWLDADNLEWLDFVAYGFHRVSLRYCYK